MQYSLDHIHLRCSDLNACVAFYKKMFNAKEVGRGDAKGMPIVFMEMGGGRFSLSPKREGLDIEAEPGKPGWGLYQIGFRVDDLDAVLLELKELGAEISRGPLVIDESLSVAFVNAPDGVEIELMAQKSRS